MAEGPTSNGTISRRHVLVGAAWATPAVLVATAAPASAVASPELGFLYFANTIIRRETVLINDLDWAQRPLLVVDPDIANASPAGGPTVTGVTLTFSVPKAWLPGGTLGWHGAFPWLVGGGSPGFTVSIAEGASAYVFVLSSALPLTPNNGNTWSPEYRIELDPAASVVGQSFTVRAGGDAAGTPWFSNSTATIT